MPVDDVPLQMPLDFPSKGAQYEASIQGQFAAFDRAHPEVYAHFRRLAEQALRVRAHYGSKAILEVVRWELTITARGAGEDFKINNNFSSRFARKLMAEDARFADFFELRALRTA